MAFPLAPVAKLALVVGSGQLFGVTTPMVASLIWPFVLKVLLSLRPIHQIFTSSVYASRLFFYQMGQIAFSPQPQGLAGRRTRLQRTVQLINQRLVVARNSAMEESDEESLRAFSVLAL